MQNEKGERKTEGNYIKIEEKAHKNAFFGYKFKKNRRGSSEPHCFLPPQIFLSGEKESQKRGGGDDRMAQYIPLFFILASSRFPISIL